MMTAAQTLDRMGSAVAGPPEDRSGDARDYLRTGPGGPPRRGVGARQRTRPIAPAVDPSIVFGCVDWYLYPDPELERERLSR